jgi:CHAD domain-containing protein
MEHDAWHGIVAPARKVRGLRADESFRTAAGKILWTRFEEMMSFTEVALEGKDIEGVHDMRVGSRRLRAALEMCRDVFPRAQYRPTLRSVKLLADALGKVRDLDVMIDGLEKDLAGRPSAQRLVLKGLRAEMISKRAKARTLLLETIDECERTDFARRFLAFVALETT